MASARSWYPADNRRRSVARPQCVCSQTPPQTNNRNASTRNLQAARLLELAQSLTRHQTPTMRFFP
eukprot:171691-Amphidinium_carterae.1